jgi:HprK-related kinase A
VKVSALSENELARRLASEAGLSFRSGPFGFRIRSPIPSVAAGLWLLYADYPLMESEAFADFTLDLKTGEGVHRWWRPQVRVVTDGYSPFEPLPVSHAYPQLEWAMNWCISTQSHQYLMLHSAVVEREGLAMILPAPPGSGKSTLCSGLIHRGWRLLSDELALVSLQPDRLITPLGRPVSLKNQSVDVIRGFAPEAVFNAITHGTAKGSVTHMKVPGDHIARIDERARPRWVVFPKYEAGARAMLTERSKAQSLLELGRNAFNYTLLGLRGFEALADLVDACDCYDFRYSNLDHAVETFDDMVATAVGRA